MYVITRLQDLISYDTVCHAIQVTWADTDEISGLWQLLHVLNKHSLIDYVMCVLVSPHIILTELLKLIHTLSQIKFIVLSL